MLRKTAISTLLLGLTGLVFADAAHANKICTLGKRVVPCAKAAWSLGVDGLYLRNDDNQEADLDDGGGNIQSGLGFRVTGSYHFDEARDITLSNTYFNKTSRWTFVNSSDNSLSHVSESKFNMINLELGQKFQMGTIGQARYHIGLQHANFRDFSEESGVKEYIPKVYGFGPRVGLSIKHALTNSIGLYSDTNIAWVRATLEDPNDAVPTAKTNTISSDAHFGVYYDHNLPSGELMLKLGWEILSIKFSSWDENDLNKNSWSGFRAGMKWQSKA